MHGIVKMATLVNKHINTNFKLVNNAQVAERTCSVLFEQRVFGIICAYASHKPLICSETEINTNLDTNLLFVKPCRIAVANNIIC